MAATTADAVETASRDLVERYRAPILGVLIRFGDELLDEVRDRKGVNVEDVRREVLDPLREAAEAAETIAKTTEAVAGD